MSLEQRVNYQLNKFPALKKIIKRVYQLVMYTISPKIKSEGDITRVSPDDEFEYFFGYYDKSPWDHTERYMLCLQASDTSRDVAPIAPANIVLFDVENGYRTKKLATTNAWNVQQGCMVQWRGPKFCDEIIYNDFREGNYCSVILNIVNNTERIISMPVYTVSNDGKTALSLDFSRLHRLRKGYGYSNLPDKTESEKLPNQPCIWSVDLDTGSITPLLKYTDFANFEPRVEMIGAEHKVNHLMLSPNGKRFMVLHRWIKGQRKYTRLVTCNIDGTDMYNLSDEDMVSHCYWKNDEEILAFENKHESGAGYYLMRDKSREFARCWSDISNDGHPSYSPDGNSVVIDSYPDKARIASIKVMVGKETKSLPKTIVKVFAPFKYDNDTRCDLHPRWDHNGEKICFDSVYENKRGLYIVKVGRND